ncbi:hypothetical protein BDB00DRAFT_849234 [Zychaea mexicana]|uniref:uncharacterized protein n=1 Tax=Zychaea mexicana TaxID=64656 RepID=UPI0022FE00F4|nr:uncharacterized protein BDB00DRAFT_849234 [Zychaea mexicana]KAI9488258.1 hypothetical protein BDB00DRAFT_849234 [Zychaea mexicana]
MSTSTKDSLSTEDTSLQQSPRVTTKTRPPEPTLTSAAKDAETSVSSRADAPDLLNDQQCEQAQTQRYRQELSLSSMSLGAAPLPPATQEERPQPQPQKDQTHQQQQDGQVQSKQEIQNEEQTQQQEVQQQQQQPSEQTGAAQEYLTKRIRWFDFATGKKKDVLIITQNENGPCPLVAICNVLFLRGDLEIRPPDREEVTFEYLVERLGDYLLNHGPSPNTDDSKRSENQQQQQEVVSASPTQYEATDMDRVDSRQSTAEYVLTYRYNLDAALSILPNLQMGLDVNVRFSSIRGFEPTAELAMFDLFGVDLVHGWLADPQDRETYRIVAEKCGSYNSVVECVVRGDTLSSGAVVESADGKHAMNGGSKQWSPEEERQIQEGLVAAAFLEDTATQLTYHGLESLVSTIPSNKLCVLFRNNHFSTLFKHPETSTLYILVTDSGLASEEMVVWENLGDVDQGSSEFFNSMFKKPEIVRSPPPQAGQDDLDYVLALSLQQHEFSSAEEEQRRHRQQQEQWQQQQQQQQQQLLAEQRHTDHLAAKRKKKQSCIIC